jgi:hypothetical protein
VRSYIEQLKGYDGISGSYDFTDGTQRGVSQKDILIVRWDRSASQWQKASAFGGDPIR